MKFTPPTKIPESNVQAEIYRQLRNRGIKCCLEYRMECAKYSRHIRADIAIVKEDEIICLVECKSRKVGAKLNINTRQFNCYRSLGVDFFYCLGWHEIKTTVNKIIERVSRHQ